MRGRVYISMETVMCHNGPSPGKLEVAQARKRTSLQAHCIYREGCWD